jgi:hypothetical protein
VYSRHPVRIMFPTIRAPMTSSRPGRMPQRWMPQRR